MNELGSKYDQRFVSNNSSGQDNCISFEEQVAVAQVRLEQQLAHPLPGPRPELHETDHTVDGLWGQTVEPEVKARTILVAYKPAQ